MWSELKVSSFLWFLCSAQRSTIFNTVAWTWSKSPCTNHSSIEIILLIHTTFLTWSAFESLKHRVHAFQFTNSQNSWLFGQDSLHCIRIDVTNWKHILSSLFCNSKAFFLPNTTISWNKFESLNHFFEK